MFTEEKMSFRRMSAEDEEMYVKPSSSPVTVSPASFTTHMYHLQMQMLSTVWLELQKWLMLHCLARRWIDQHSLLLELLRDSFIFQTWKHNASCRSCQFVDLCHSLGQIFSPDFVRPFIYFLKPTAFRILRRRKHEKDIDRSCAFSASRFDRGKAQGNQNA